LIYNELLTPNKKSNNPATSFLWGPVLQGLPFAHRNRQFQQYMFPVGNPTTGLRLVRLIRLVRSCPSKSVLSIQLAQLGFSSCLAVVCQPIHQPFIPPFIPNTRQNPPSTFQPAFFLVFVVAAYWSCCLACKTALSVRPRPSVFPTATFPARAFRAPPLNGDFFTPVLPSWGPTRVDCAREDDFWLYMLTDVKGGRSCSSTPPGLPAFRPAGPHPCRDSMLFAALLMAAFTDISDISATPRALKRKLSALSVFCTAPLVPRSLTNHLASFYFLSQTCNVNTSSASHLEKGKCGADTAAQKSCLRAEERGNEECRATPRAGFLFAFPFPCAPLYCFG